MIIWVEWKNLGLANKPSYWIGIDGPVAVALELGSPVLGVLYGIYVLNNLSNPRVVEKPAPRHSVSAHRTWPRFVKGTFDSRMPKYSNAATSRLFGARDVMQAG